MLVTCQKKTCFPLELIAIPTQSQREACIAEIESNMWKAREKLIRHTACSLNTKLLARGLQILRNNPLVLLVFLQIFSALHRPY